MKTAGICTKIREVTSSKITLAAMAICAAGLARAAHFKPTTGGNLDDPDNWSSTSDTTYGVVKQQSAALTISSASATLPNNGSLLYRTNVHTNDFGAGNTLTVAGLTVEQGATLVHKSGTIDSTGAATFNNGAAVFTGTGSVLDGTSATLLNGGALTIEDGAAWNFTRSVTINSGTKVVADGATLSMNTPSTGTSYYITVNEGGTFAVKDSTVYLANGKAHIDINNATATFDGSTISMGTSNASSIGGDGGTLLFTGSASAINQRFPMTGDDFTFCVSNTTVNFAPATTSDLFITGSGAATEELAKTLRFCGSARLSVASSGGLHLRGTKGVKLQFDLDANSAPDSPMVEITNASGSFKGDGTCLSASQVVVNINKGCEEGTYTLMKGKAATTFITNAEKWLVNCVDGYKASLKTAGTSGSTDECLQVVVMRAGLAIIVR